MGTRRVELHLWYDGQDISEDVWPFVTSFQHADRTKKDAMDEIGVTFQDVDGLWKRGWFPELGAKFEALIRTHNWFKDGEILERECGSFEIDDVSCSGPPSVFTISAVAVGITSSIRRQENTKAWENFNVRSMSEEIASKHGFELKWYSNYNPAIDRMDQKSESDLSFHGKVCDYAGLTRKITDKALIVFRGEEFDSEEPILTVRIGESDGLKAYNFNANCADIYSACEVKYYDSKKKELLKYLYFPDGLSGTRRLKKGEGGVGGSAKATSSVTGGGRMIDPVTRMEIRAPAAKKQKEQEIREPDIGQVLKINRRCSSLSEAEEVAKAALRGKNMRHVKGTLSFMGHPIIYSGANILVEGAGRFDTVTWQIEEVTHNYSKGSGYTTEVQIRGVLGY